MAKPPTLLWLRRDLRLDDHAAMHAALGDGGPVIPVFILEPGYSGSELGLGRRCAGLAPLEITEVFRAEP